MVVKVAAPVNQRGEALVDLPPLAGVPHVGEIEAAVADVFQAGEGGLEGRPDGGQPTAAVGGAK